jgi:FkbH-like protein
MPIAGARRGQIKCVVWDLDNTVWDGTLLENDDLVPKARVRDIIATLDGRGVLHSIASRNDHDAAMEKLEEYCLAEYFLHPQINFNPKSVSITQIADDLNIGLDAIAFIDDQPFELDEVHFAHPPVTCVNSQDLADILARPEFTPKFITSESRQRRAYYQSGTARDRAQKLFAGTDEEFLATLGMVFTIAPAGVPDLQRAHELTVRTNQLNSTGRTYSYDELSALADSPDHLLMVASLADRYGGYGTIGLALVETRADLWTLRLLLMSCRVMARGVGTVLLRHIMGLAAARDIPLHAEFVRTGRNRVMYVTYRFAGFEEVSSRDDSIVLAAPSGRLQLPPTHLTVIAQ